MHKKRTKTSKNYSRAIFKKTSVSALIPLLLTALFKMSGSLHEAPATQLPSTDQPVALYSNQSNDDLSHIYLNAIRNAKQSVVMVIYSLIDPRIISALQEKCNEGVPVHIVCDAKASLGITRKLAGASIIKRIGQGLMHQKILIIDQKKILLGSANMTQDSLCTHGNLVVALDHANLAEVMTAKAKSMDDEGNFIPLMHQQFKAGSQNVELWELPDDSQAISKVIQLLRSAKKSIRVAMFTWTRRDFTQELIEAKKRGVKVEAVIDRCSGKGASAKIVKNAGRGEAFLYD